MMAKTVCDLTVVLMGHLRTEIMSVDARLPSNVCISIGSSRLHCSAPFLRGAVAEDGRYVLSMMIESINAEAGTMRRACTAPRLCLNMHSHTNFKELVCG